MSFSVMQSDQFLLSRTRATDRRHGCGRRPATGRSHPLQTRRRHYHRSPRPDPPLVRVLRRFQRGVRSSAPRSSNALGLWREHWTDRRAAQESERCLQRGVVLRLFGHVRLRTFFLFPLRAEMPWESRLADLILGRLQPLRDDLANLDIWLDPFSLNRVTRRREVTRGGQAQRAIAWPQWNDDLNRSLAKRAGAEDGRAFLVLQRAGDDF